MSAVSSTLTIRAGRLGTVQEVKQVLTDIETAYNSVYAFDFLVDTLSNDRERRLRLLDDRFSNWKKHWDELPEPDALVNSFLFEIFWGKFLHRIEEITVDLRETQLKLDINKIVLPSDKLSIVKANFQAESDWEFRGERSTLQQIGEYLSGMRQGCKVPAGHMHEEPEETASLSNIGNQLADKVNMLCHLGYDADEVNQLVAGMVIEPLNKLVEHIDEGLIYPVE